MNIHQIQTLEATIILLIVVLVFLRLRPRPKPPRSHPLPSNDSLLLNRRRARVPSFHM